MRTTACRDDAGASMRGMLVVAALMHAAPSSHAAAQPEKRSLAILQISADLGVKPETARLVTELLSNAVRTRMVFDSVVSASELEALVGLERQKQMAACDSTACIAELSGALGVSHIMTGSVAQLGSSFLLTLRVMDVRESRTVGSVTRRTRGDTEEALLDVIEPAVEEALAGLTDRTPPTTVDPAPVSPPAPGAPAPALATPPPGEAGEPSLRKPLFVSGGMAAALTPLAFLVAVGLFGATVASQVVPRIRPVPSFGLGYTFKYAMVTGTGGALAVATLLAVMTGLSLAGGAAVLFGLGVTR